eukprot:8390268-Pyramimonas_sp.AAC.1
MNPLDLPGTHGSGDNCPGLSHTGLNVCSPLRTCLFRPLRCSLARLRANPCGLTGPLSVCLSHPGSGEIPSGP